MHAIDTAEFEKVVDQSFHLLPLHFQEAIENVAVIVEDLPTEEIVRQMNLPSKYHLLGLYQGIPLTKRGSWYGTTPVSPDKISLYQRNIESSVLSLQELERKIADVLIHEIAHYFGMNEEEVRKAGY